MAENWLNDKLCSLGDDQVRVEQGPQIVELDCTDENLSNEITAAHYQLGQIDALGRFIRPMDVIDNEQDDDKKQALKAYFYSEIDKGRGTIGAGEKMACVDWRGKIAGHVWKVYQMKGTGKFDVNGKEIKRFTKIDEFEKKDDAMTFAASLVAG